MNEVELNRLIEKYYSGESTEEDEKTLRAYFSSNTFPDGYETEKEIFSYYMTAMEVPEPSIDFEARIIEKIVEPEIMIRHNRLRRYILPLISTAAGLLIVTGSYFFLTNRNELRDTYSDPELAYAETMKILMDVSSQLNQGTRALEPVGRINNLAVKSFKSINKSTRIVEKKLEWLQKTIETSDASAE